MIKVILFLIVTTDFICYYCDMTHFYREVGKVKVKVSQSSLTLCDPMDYRVHGIPGKWAALPFSGGSSQPRDRTQVSRTAGRFFTN